jgi:hypothetical protein
MSNIITNFIAGALMSLSKINQVKDKETLTDDVENEIVQEQKVHKQEIKLISQKKFYEILNRSEEIGRLRNSKRTEKILEARGITSIDFISFKNETFEPSLHEQLTGNIEPTYKFKTDNNICKYASDVHIKEEENKLTLNFLINIEQHPFIGKNSNSLTNLTAFAINHNAKIYAYEIIKFEGVIKRNPFEIFLVFEAKCVVNGEYARELSNESRTIGKDDIIDPKTFRL